jgi:hypothetical protein
MFRTEGELLKLAAVAASSILILILLIGCGKDKEAPLIPDTTGPRVSATSPSDGDSNVALNASVTVTFSENVDPLTITGSSFYLSGGLTGTITYSSKSASLVPDSNLQYGTDYTAAITTAVTDVAGNHMDSDYTWSFTTNFGDLMPLAIGNRWEFQVVNYTNPVVPDTSYDTILVVRDTTIDTERWFILNDGAVTTNRDDGLWRMTATGTPYLWLKFPGLQNQTYNADPVRGESVKITSTSQIVTSPTLPLLYCYVYESTYSDPSTKDVFYYAPRVGPAVLVHDTIDIFTTLLVRKTLIRYQLN